MRRLTIRSRNTSEQGFTIVELLIVIIVIGILAAISIVAYSGIQTRAKAASLQSDLEQAAQQIESYKIAVSTSGQYPADQATAGLKPSNGNSFNYQVNNAATPPTYCLNDVNGATTYSITSTNSTPTSGACT